MQVPNCSGPIGPSTVRMRPVIDSSLTRLPFFSIANPGGCVRDLRNPRRSKLSFLRGEGTPNSLNDSRISEGAGHSASPFRDQKAAVPRVYTVKAFGSPRQKP